MIPVASSFFGTAAPNIGPWPATTGIGGSGAWARGSAMTDPREPRDPNELGRPREPPRRGPPQREPPRRTEPREAIRALRDELLRHGFAPAFQTDLPDMSVLSVWYNLTVWCAGETFLWRSGYAFEDFDTHPVEDPAGAARRILRRYDELRTRRDLYGGLGS